MAELLAGLGTSHVPSIAAALDKGLRNSVEWKPFFDGYIPAQDWIAQRKPDIAVVIYNDHGNSFFLDRVPTLALGVSDIYRPADEGWGPRPVPDFQGADAFAWHLADRMVEGHFDPLICRELDVDHGLQVPMELTFGRPDAWPVKVVPILINTIQYPIPTPQRMWDLGRLLRRAIESYPTDEKVLVMGTGGLSHQLQGARAGFINPTADREWIARIGSNPERYRTMSREDYVEEFGSEGAELIMWLVMRGCMDDTVTTLFDHYFAPASMTGAGMVLLENTR
ncbi:MAG: protocatechuate 3,4-dioxygenase [Rhodobacteraceae bacterium]|nr:protocatechuate 3,4-dioxygenase [Paracoccaceae bacterium]